MLSGSCLCGTVKYETDGPLTAVTRCHCVQCRKASGAEFATNGSVPLAGFRVLSGAEALGRFESSPGKFRVFCSRCGSPLFKEYPVSEGVVRLRLGSLDSELPHGPTYHVFVSEKPSWSEICDELPQHPRLPSRT